MGAVNAGPVTTTFQPSLPNASSTLLVVALYPCHGAPNVISFTFAKSPIACSIRARGPEQKPRRIAVASTCSAAPKAPTKDDVSPARGTYIAKSTRLLPTMMVDANVPRDDGLPFGTKQYWPALMSVGTSMTILTFAGIAIVFSPSVYLIVRTWSLLSKTDPSV